MKRILIAGAFALVTGAQAFAADLPPPAPMPPPRAPAAYIPAPPPVYNWGGIYFGINGGYGFGSSTWNTPLGSSGSFAVDGGMVGGTLGFNYQISQFVLGIEGDFDWQNLRGAGTSTAVCGPVQGCDTSSNWIGTFRGRVGWAMDRIMLYGTAGGAVTDIRAATGSTFPVGGSPVWTSNAELGWTAGAGVEGAITDNITVKAEYLFADFEKGACTGTSSCGGTPPNNFSGSSVSFYENMIRAGINLKFN